MALDAAHIDRIVREVIRQLQAQTSPTADGSAGSTTRELAAHGSTSDPAARLTASLPTTLVVTERLVTGELLRGRLSGIDCLQVERHAIVTPLVNDLLRDRKIRLERRAQQIGNNGEIKSKQTNRSDQTEPHCQRVGLFAEPLGTGAIWTPMPKSRPTEWLSMNRLDELISSLRTATCCCGVAITRDWATLVRNANQHQTIRAAVVWSPSSVQQAVTQLNPNLIVIDAATANASDIDAWVALALNR